MSLINQMLQDLEKRQPAGEAHPLSTVRAVPRPRRVRLFRPLLLLLGAAAGAFAWQLWQTPAPREAAPVPATAAAPAPSARPSVVAAPAPQTKTPAAMPEKQLTPEARASSPSLPDSRPVSEPAPQEPTELARLANADVPSPQPPKQQAAAPAKTAADNPTGASEAAPPTPGAIAKQVREPTPRQRADNEYRKALSLVQQGRLAEAIDGLALALQMNAGHTAARQTLIGLLVEARRFGEAERRLQEGLNLDRAQPELAMTLARLQVERGDTDAAIATLERTLPHAADRADYHAFMAALLQRGARHREAIEHYRQALHRAPYSAVWQMGLGISLQAENRLQEARDAFSRAMAANTLSPELQAFVEQRLKQLGQ